MQDDKKRLQIRDESLSPDEAHSIEVRVDKMLRVDEPGSPPPAGDDLEKKQLKAQPLVEKALAASPKSAPEPPAELVPGPEPVVSEEAETPAEPEIAEVPAESEQTDEIAQLAAEQAANETGSGAGDKLPETDTFAAKERDAELAAQDAEIAAAFSEPDKPKGSRFKRFIAAWW